MVRESVEIMIFGIGTDIVQIARIAESLERQGERFAHKLLGDDELLEFQRRCERNPQKGVRYLATRFAAKEAFSKALGLGIHPPMRWRDMQTLNLENGKPEIHVLGDLRQWMSERAICGQISLSDEEEYAVAFVVLERQT